MHGNSLDLCQLLEWDSAFFGFRVARLRCNLLTPPTVAEAFEWCAAERIRCLYFLAAADCSSTTALAEAHGFHLMDFRVTLNCKLSVEPEASVGVRAYRPGDLPALRDIAAASYRDSRFYYDSNFPAERCDALYQTWLERSCNGYADAVLVAEFKGKPAGYISCHGSTNNTGSIGLVAVAGWARGSGLGSQLVSASLRYFWEKGCRSINVVTQGRNCAAQRLYQKHGFQSASVEIWYHRWFEPGSNSL